MTFIAAYGRLWVQTLPVRMRVYFSGVGGETNVWFCACCELYNRTEANLIQHLQDTGHATAILDLVSQRGLELYVRARCQWMLLVEHREDQDAAVDAAVAAV